MNLRPPAAPLVTIDPYFSIWSMKDTLNEDKTRHWTGKDAQLRGTVCVDGTVYRFMGDAKDGDTAMTQTSLTFDALSTRYTFSCDKITLEAVFTSPLLMDDLKLCSRPVSYIKVTVTSADGASHKADVVITADDELCVNFKGEFPTKFESVPMNGIVCGRVGSTIQKPLNKSGDDLRINWGYLYGVVACDTGSVTADASVNEYGTPVHTLVMKMPLDTGNNNVALFALAYEDTYAIEYFGKPAVAYWKKDGDTLEPVIEKAIADYDDIMKRCDDFAAELKKEAVENGSEKYADLLALAYRQAIAGHKIAAGDNGEVLFISKENFSNGCAATVDVTYPSIPLFLIYNPELVKGMLRPIFKYAAMPEWFYDFAPHDAGTYPLVNGQIYSHGTCPQWQMPVEECGNMLVCTASVATAEKDASFAVENWDILEKWCEYLCKEGMDPSNQLCTDDFAGHLAHNCNLSIKAIMGIESFAILCQMTGKEDQASKYQKIAKEMAGKWLSMAANGDGTYRLAFDQPDTFSMKYNAIWDELFGTGVFPAGCFDKELASYTEKHLNQYGMPLDSRADYTKSDWLLYVATMGGDRDRFNKLADSLWAAYNESETRVPMTDWYDTKTAKMIGFQNRTVQGGLFIQLLKVKNICDASGCLPK